MPFLIYCAAAIACTWPLALHPAALLGAPVGPGDPYLNLWILGWGMQAVLSDPLSIVSGRVFDANIFHPAAGTLAYSDHLLLQSVMLAPLYAVTHDVVLCYNVLLLGSLVASALAMHVFVRAVVGSTGGAYLAGLAWGFGSYRFAHLIHLQLQALYFLPLAFLFLHRVIAGRRRGDAVMLGLLSGLQAVASVYYAVIGGVALLCAGVALSVTAARRSRGVIARRLILAAAVAGLVCLPVAIVYWRVQQDAGFGRNLYEASRGAAYADSYLQAPPGNVLYGRSGVLRHGDSAVNDGPPHTGPERELFPGVVLVALALVGVWAGWRTDARPLVISMAGIALVGFVLSLGPDGVRPLYAGLHRFVFGFQAIRAPARFAVLVLFGLSTLAALGWRELSTRVHHGAAGRVSRAAGVLLVALAALEWWHVPVALATAPALHTSVGEWLRQAPGSGAVAVLPLGLDIDSTPAMVQSLEHRRALVNGYSGQRPAFYPALADALSTFPSAEAVQALHESGVQYVVVPEAVARPESDAPWPLEPRAQFTDGVIYELEWTPAIGERYSRMSSVTPLPPGRVPFTVGEQARYTVAWDGGGVSLAAGEITTTVEPPAYRIVVTAETAPWVARFFEAQDRFVTTTDGQLLPRVHEREQHEGSRHVTQAFVYDAAGASVHTGRTLEEARGKDAVTLPMPPSTRDALAALFYARTQPLETGGRFELPVNENGRNLVLEVAVAGRESIQVQGRMVDAIRLEPKIRERVERRRQPTAVLWLSADERRVPLLVEITAVFGRIRVELSSYQPGS